MGKCIQRELKILLNSRESLSSELDGKVPAWHPENLKAITHQSIENYLNLLWNEIRVID